MCAKRSVELDIKVTGENQINDINNELKETSINAEKVADQTLKLTKGIAGGFELAAQAAGYFGEETGKAFEETVQRATQYIALSNALKDVAEGFSKENVKGLTAIFKGFTKAGIGAKLFGTTTAAAITATGIGAFVVAIGLLAANWEAVTDAVGEFIDSIPFLKSIKDTVNELIDRVGSLSNLLDGVGAFIVALFTEGKSAVDEFNKAITEGKVQEELEGQYEKLVTLNKERENSIKLLEKEGNKEKEVFAIRRQVYTEIIANLEKRKKLSEDEIKQLEDAKFQLKLLAIEEKKYYDLKKKESADAIAKAKEVRDKEKEEQRKINEERLKNEEEAIKRIRDINIALEADKRKAAIDTINAEFDDRVDQLKIGDKYYTEEVLKLNELRNLKIKEQNDKFAEEDRQIAIKIAEENLERIVKTSEMLAESGAFDELKRKFNGVFDDPTGRDALLLLQVYLGQLSRLGVDTTESLNQINDALALVGLAVNEYGDLIEVVAEKPKVLSEAWREGFTDTAELIIAYAELAGDNIGQIFDILVERQQKELEGLSLQFQLIDSQYTEAVNNRRALEAELATAQGARYDEIINSLKEEEEQEKRLAAEKEKLAKKQIDIQNKINQQEYANAVIQSTILTANAILAALATVPPASFVFAAITAGLAAVQTAIVIANKPKPITYATGGFTEGIGQVDHTGHEVAGVVHANEYVVPSSVLNTDTGYRMVAALEAMRQGKPTFADGGLTTPNIDNKGSNGTESLLAALQGLNLQVAVTEINTVSNRVRVIEEKASI